MSNKADTEQQQRSQALTDAENHIKEACEILQREARRVRQEQESIDAMSKELDQVHISSTVKLNVGGQYFTTSVQTLTKDPNSMLAAMFSGKNKMKPSEDGSFFIDRDGTHFRLVLNYLRNGELILPGGASKFIKELEAEAKFYQLQGILDELKPKLFEESLILLKEEHRRVLRDWLPEDLEGTTWRLLYRASRDGFAADVFHSKCDNRGPTITVVNSGGNVFGGFTTASWTTESRGYKPCSYAFLFSLVDPSDRGPTKIPLNPGKQEHAIWCGTDWGPVFGGGCEISISDNANQNTKSDSKLGDTYQFPPGQQNTYFTGAKNFTVADYEVFGFYK